MVGRWSFPFGMAYFQGRTVSFRVCMSFGTHTKEVIMVISPQKPCIFPAIRPCKFLIPGTEKKNKPTAWSHSTWPLCCFFFASEDIPKIFTEGVEALRPFQQKEGNYAGPRPNMILHGFWNVSAWTTIVAASPGSICRLPTGSGTSNGAQ